MLHVRVIAPPSVSVRVQQQLTGDEAVTHLIVLPGAAKAPAGDVVEFDVVREGASKVLDGLRALGVDRDGAIVVEKVDATLSAAADRAARRTPGLGVDAVVWHEIEHQTGEETALSASFLTFMSVATVIAAVGVLLDQPILIVGSMVVGPEFGPLAAMCVGLVQRKFTLFRRSVLALAVGFPVGMLVTVGAVWLLTAAGLVDKSMLLEPRPLTDFIWRPDALSWVIGFLGGIAGILSLTSAKAGTLVGVLISVTTVPAAANAAVALAYGVREEAYGSALQLAINLAAIVVAGVLTLLVQQIAWKWPRRTAR
ncbi:DUF389 domain-containing protein [Actinoplanes derwentensis]|uniref:Uncharacterized hydrophobic domain-containing protein n=1 Tax=Actinoplanes derwentensis TaxID=113562 RepID=A0A1H2CW31_9ACTN|nr:DUF389 domain-containing protein [Actinoplanes derwentensis]GID88354.1 hypothetical protein Ade03nite_72780 [Actinoplanes derwentensis]SDT74683.1 uncharacterized hydrophobic domain-containing protein [Actinoplanes derwentensis]